MEIRERILYQHTQVIQKIMRQMYFIYTDKTAQQT